MISDARWLRAHARRAARQRAPSSDGVRSKERRCPQTGELPQPTRARGTWRFASAAKHQERDVAQRWDRHELSDRSLALLLIATGAFNASARASAHGGVLIVRQAELLGCLLDDRFDEQLRGAIERATVASCMQRGAPTHS